MIPCDDYTRIILRVLAGERMIIDEILKCRKEKADGVDCLHKIHFLACANESDLRILKNDLKKDGVLK